MDASLNGLSVGDAFGERFFGPPGVMTSRIAARELPAGPWRWTDDTAMALSVVEVLKERGTIDRDALAAAFGRRYLADRHRGYGPAAHGILEELGQGGAWEVVAKRPFGGTGSKGNGGAMRAAPIGAFFAGDPARVVEEARASAVVTHFHPEGQAGAIAVALAAAWAAKPDGALLPFVVRWMPPSETRRLISEVAEVALDHEPWRVATKFGAGERVLAEDTVPFSLWCAARHADDFQAAMWTTVSALGDRDTTCAIVGGIVGIRSAPPAAWLVAREPLP